MRSKALNNSSSELKSKRGEPSPSKAALIRPAQDMNLP